MPIPDFLTGPLVGLLGALVGAVVGLYYRGNYFKVKGELKASELHHKMTKKNMEIAATENAATIVGLKNKLERKDKILEDAKKDYDQLLSSVKESGRYDDVIDEQWGKLSEGGS